MAKKESRAAGYERVVLAIIANAAADGRWAEFANAEEKQALKRLEKKGTVEIKKTGAKVAGLEEWAARRVSSPDHALTVTIDGRKV